MYDDTDFVKPNFYGFWDNRLRFIFTIFVRVRLFEGS